ncbi:uncharacterized protein LOC134687988 [Mytilus trossulus]|uniref:uncharacterized protein LOC134687988 n=1 Tax=Mytilus trossulus TaxID=6551 RepID=UPI0030047A6A
MSTETVIRKMEKVQGKPFIETEEDVINADGQGNLPFIIDDSVKTQSPEDARPKRVRKLTSGGQELYEKDVGKYTAELIHYRKNLDILNKSYYSGELEISDVKLLPDRIRSELSKYQQISEKFIGFLNRYRTEESAREEATQKLIYKSIMSKAKTMLNEIEIKLKQSQSVKSVATGRKSKSSRSSSASSMLIKQRAKMDAAKTNLRFVSQEAELERLQFELEEEELKTKAELLKKKVEAKLKMNILKSEKEVAIAEAEFNAVREEMEMEGSRSSGRSMASVVDPRQHVERYLQEQRELMKSGYTNPQQMHPPELNVHATPFEPKTEDIRQTNYEINNVSVANELSKFLLKKDLLMSRFMKFNDQAESYHVWKASFSNITEELSVNAREELDLLMKWLGPESSKHAESLRIANAKDPVKCLKRVWERLEERYGGPEMVETNVKSKLNKFPIITNKDHKKLYELSDILTEIESLKEDERYAQLLSYFDTSLGVNTVITKLPYGIQNKWIDRAMRYKQNHNVLYPPFPFFVSFIREMCKQFNDPGFAFKEDTKPQQTKSYPNNNRYNNKVTARKTDVSQEKQFKTTGPTDKLTECPIHHSKHSLNNCRGFRQKSINDRRKILRENNICYKCCESTTHISRDCKESVTCKDCGSNRHSSAMHIDRYDKTTREIESVSSHGGEEQLIQTVETKCTAICGEGFSGKSCSKVVLVKVYKKDEPEKYINLYALMDDQSNRTLGRTELFDALNIDSAVQPYTLSSCAGSVQKQGRLASGLVVEPIDGRVRMDLPTVIECNDIPETREEIPVPEITKYYEHLKRITLPPIDPEAHILLLIGRDLADAHHVYEQKTGAQNTPFAQRLSLGWVIIGEVCLGQTHKPNSKVNVCKTNILNNGRPTSFEVCKNVFNIKETVNTRNHQDTVEDQIFHRTKDDNKIGMSVEDHIFIDIMDKEFVKSETGNWSAPLPFRKNRPRLPDNRSQALRRARMLDQSLQKSTSKRQHFVEFMGNMFRNGHAEEAPTLEQNEECWYLPLFGVYHPKKKDKIRVVFDSSAKQDGISLNNVLLSGPDFTNSLVGVLLRFRKERIAVMADIEQMFYCFKVNSSHRNFLRFFWYKNNIPGEQLIEYRMCVHVFGNTPSPAIATYGLRKCVENEPTENDVKEYVNRNFYVDDGLVNFTNEEEAVSVLKRTQQSLLENGKLKLHKIASNSEKVMNAFNPDELAKELKTLDLNKDELPIQHSLGMSWDLQQDSFTYKLSNEEKPITRRGVLSSINSLFDPLGFISPVILQGRILMRDIIAETTDWDLPLSNDIQQKWIEWRDSLRPIEQFSIRRTFVESSFCSSLDKQLHIFSDASEQAIASVAFLRTSDAEFSINTGFVFGKCKVAPKHGHTIPRLELCAAVMAVEIGEIICEHLDMNLADVKYYTDSKVVLGYINNQVRRFQVYVANRVGKIRKASKPEQWTYVNTDHNPADIGTRLIFADQLQTSSWLTGPTFLQESDTLSHSIATPFPLINPNTDKELKTEIQVIKSVLKCDNLGSQRFNRFSNWWKLVRTISRLQRLASSYSHNKLKDNLESNELEAHRKAEIFIIKEVQKEDFGREIECLRNKRPLPNNSSVLSLSPVLDENGILRVGGRLRNAKITSKEKTPILISGKHHIATLLVRHYHNDVQHQGRHLTEGTIRSAGWWITGCKRLVSSIIFKCVKCRRLRGSLSEQKMADLPDVRLSPCAPFSFVGVDVFGPWNIVTRRTRGGAANSKRWAVLFTCLASRAVHIEVIEEMSSSSFINALRRFYALRGKVQEFRSDRGSNFVGCTDALQIDALNVEDGEVRTLLNKNRTIWRFNTPHSSHMGGSWERMIGIARKILNNMLFDVRYKNLTHEVLTTFMAEVTAIMNARPIVPVSTDSDNPTILTPSLLLTQKTSDQEDSFENITSTACMYQSQWKYVQTLAEIFWKRWSREYLQTLQKRQKWKKEVTNLKQGDIILMREKDMVRSEWPIGTILRTFASENDNLIRKIEVRVIKQGKPVIYVRPITEIVELLSE